MVASGSTSTINTTGTSTTNIVMPGPSPHARRAVEVIASISSSAPTKPTLYTTSKAVGGGCPIAIGSRAGNAQAAKYKSKSAAGSNQIR